MQEEEEEEEEEPLINTTLVIDKYVMCFSLSFWFEAQLHKTILVEFGTHKGIAWSIFYGQFGLYYYNHRKLRRGRHAVNAAY